jgi:hypothetical protein
MTQVHEIVAAIAAEESIYNTVEDPALEDASYFRLQALQTQLSAAIREARGEVMQCGQAKSSAR